MNATEKSKRTLAVKRLNDAYICARKCTTNPELLPRFKVHLDRLESLVTMFDENHTKIVASLTDPKDIADCEEIRQGFDETLLDMLALKSELITEPEPVAPTPADPPSNHRVRMPPIHIPTFEGGYKSWITFYDLYRTLVHEKSDISKIEKFQYLVSSLKGEPLNLIKAFPISENNYDTAYDTLVKRYQNTRQLAFLAWQSIINVKLQNNSAQAFRFLLDTFQENLAILKTLKLPVDKWDFVILHTLLSKLEPSIRKEFEMTVTSEDIPSYRSLENFVENYCKAVEHAGTSAGSVPGGSTRPAANTARNDHGTTALRRVKQTTLVGNQSVPSSSSPPPPCQFCSKKHFLAHCPDFQNLTVAKRSQVASEKQLCFNCLRVGHGVSSCTSKGTCRLCSQRHHSLLHFNNTNGTSANEGKTNPIGTSNALGVQGLSSNATASQTVLLSTVRAVILDKWRTYQSIRLLLDSGSQANYITQSLAHRLGLDISNNAPSVFGLGSELTPVLGTVQCTVRSENDQGKELSFEAIVIGRICQDLPSIKVETDFLDKLGFIQLADPTFHFPGPIDLLLGSELWNEIFLQGMIPGGADAPVGLNTIFGWVFLGRSRCLESVPSLYSNLSAVHTLHTSQSNLDEDLKRLWEIEDVRSSVNMLSPEDMACEESFLSSYKRDASGKFVVELPFKTAEPVFRNMRSIAERRFYKLEQRLSQDSSLRQSYNDFMQDYLDSGHMSEVPSTDKNSSSSYYIPHHCVLSPSSLTTKLRVVFDASARDGVGLSLNDTQLTGPKLQKDIATILMRFRLHAVVFTADIRQMYRNIIMAEKHRDFQRIVWRFHPDDELKDYRLNTVSYGVSSSPFLALRTIEQLSITEGQAFPLGAQVLSTDTYVDDIPTGAASVNEALELQSQVIALLLKGGFELRKWASNEPKLLSHLPPEHCATQASTSFDADSHAIIKVLGLNWDSSSDQLQYKVNLSSDRCSKRQILSELARVFDPLGLLCPVVFLAKCLIQRLWLLGLDWDQEPPEDIIAMWRQFSTQLGSLSTLALPRRITHSHAVAYQLHGFADASLSGYAAVIYLQAELHDGSCVSHLVCAKSRVAPTKRISLPRLELCAATLLADLLASVIPHLSSLIVLNGVYAWSDSTITLSWIASHPSKWKIFVGNRVAKIQSKVPSARWNYISTHDNPADVASRGVLPNTLLTHPLWWTGPLFLSSTSAHWPRCAAPPLSTDATTEVRQEEQKSALLGTTETDSIQALLLRFSSLKRILRVTATVLRFLSLLRKQRAYSGPICEPELQHSLFVLVRSCQQSCFANEIRNLNQNKALTKPFRKLSPFLSDDNVLRVGGRLRHSSLEYEAKHPAILPSDHRLSALIIDDVHEKSLHGGPQMVLFLLTQNFWVLSARRVIAKRLSRCISCFRAKPKSSQPIMGDLPSVRVTAVKAFLRSGCDFAGPFQVILGRRRRGVRSEKVYLCLFVCLATKALHIEIATDLSTDCFIAALDRFVGRRGECRLILSDCGTNFVGAKNQLAEIMKTAAVNQAIEFKTIPPSSPHFGGVWEAAVRSVKGHLSRVIGSHLLTMEEFHTIIVKIEAVLNSRPLCAISNDPNDYSVLTPGHFLTRAPLTCVPNDNDDDRKLSLLNRWQLLQRLHADFWNRWHREYLHTLNQKNKWTDTTRAVSIGDLVLIRDDNLRPLLWPVGRVVNVHPGHDGVVRVATVRTVDSDSRVKEFKRPVVKLCVLPVGEE